MSSLPHHSRGRRLLLRSAARPRTSGLRHSVGRVPPSADKVTGFFLTLQQQHHDFPSSSGPLPSDGEPLEEVLPPLLPPYGIPAGVSKPACSFPHCPKLGSSPLRSSALGISRLQYLPIAISLQRLIRCVSVIGLVGNEVRTLHFIDGFNLGKSCQVFVIKDLIIHFSLGRGRERQKGRGEKEGDTGAHDVEPAQSRQSPPSPQQWEQVRGDAREAAVRRGRGAGSMGPCLSERSWSVPTALVAWLAAGVRGTACPCCPQTLGLSPGDASHCRAAPGTAAPSPGAGASVLPRAGERLSCTYADDAVWGADAGTGGRDRGF